MAKKPKAAELDLDAIPAWMDTELWTDFFQNRIDLGKPMTPIAVKRMVNKLEAMHRAGQDVNARLSESIINGWLDVYPRNDAVTQMRPAGTKGATPTYEDARRGESMEAYEARKRQEAQVMRRPFH
jgi:hypothetical protein